MIFIQVIPYDFYFSWQIDIQITNFRKFNLSDKMEILVWYPKGNPKLDIWKKLEKKYSEVKFFYYEDEGVELSLYIPQLRPHTLKKHFKIHEKRLKDKIFFYHDADIIFNYLPDFNKLCEGDINWQSDCSGYLDYSYLRRKEVQGNIPEGEAISILANIGNITIDTLKLYDGKTGGAQNILKNIDSEYWEDVERQCLEIRKAFFHGIKGSINQKYFPSESAGFQSWTCDMWAVNMALWSRGIITNVTKDLDFSWATDNAETYHKKPIYHNAGANGNQPGIFYKGKWINESPIGKKHSVKKDSASFFYVEAMNEVK